MPRGSDRVFVRPSAPSCRLTTPPPLMPIPGYPPGTPSRRAQPPGAFPDGRRPSGHTATSIWPLPRPSPDRLRAMAGLHPSLLPRRPGPPRSAPGTVPAISRRGRSSRRRGPRWSRRAARRPDVPPLPKPAGRPSNQDGRQVRGTVRRPGRQVGRARPPPAAWAVRTPAGRIPRPDAGPGPPRLGCRHGLGELGRAPPACSRRVSPDGLPRRHRGRGDLIALNYPTFTNHPAMPRPISKHRPPR